MKQFAAFVTKELYHILRDWRTMLILLGMPAVQILLFGFAINMDLENVRTAVFNPSHDNLSRQITERFAHNPYFDIQYNTTSIDQTEALLRQGRIDLAVVFPSNFENDITLGRATQIQIITDASNPNIASIATNYATAIVGQYQQEFAALGQQNYRIDTQTRMLFNPAMESAYTFVPGIMGLVLMIICTIMTSVSVVREKERGTMELLLVSPLKTPVVLVAKTIPYLAVSIINLTTILVLSYFVLNVPIRGNLFLILFISSIYIFMALSLGLLISSVVSRQDSAILICGIGLMMPTLVLSGMIFSIDAMPRVLQWISNVVPARWFIEAIKKVMIQGLGISSVLKEMAILGGMSVLFVILSISKIKNRLE